MPQIIMISQYTEDSRKCIHMSVLYNFAGPWKYPFPHQPQHTRWSQCCRRTSACKSHLGQYFHSFDLQVCLSKWIISSTTPSPPKKDPKFIFFPTSFLPSRIQMAESLLHVSMHLPPLPCFIMKLLVLNLSTLHLADSGCKREDCHSVTLAVTTVCVTIDYPAISALTY
jgi:hypothetical protein